MDAYPSSWPENVRPPTVSYDKSEWDNTFTSFSLDTQVQEKYAEAIEALKVEARRMLMAEGNTTRDKLVVIDTLERLGVGYHFHREVEDTLDDILNFDSDREDYDLFTTALRFRLLRQHRHNVSCSVFDKFKGENGKFKESLSSDAKGLLSLYEAAHLRIHEEEILDEAVAFTVHHLKRMVQQLESLLQDQVKRALERPLHRSIPRIETCYYISLYEQDKSKNELLLKLAKLDFNYLQNMYKRELGQLSRWWNELNPNLPFARDRLVEAYLWGTAFHFEPQYSYVRVAIVKSIQILTVINDVYDNHATVEEGDIFTEILERWNIDEIGPLPDYMKLIHRSILRMYEDYKREAVEQEKSFAAPYAKETIKQICRAYNKRFKWFSRRETPSFEDYIANSTITSCLYVFCSWTIPGIKSVSKETIDWLMSEPQIVIASAKVCRYLDDLGGFERESKQGRLMTGVGLYMKQYGVSQQETNEKFIELAEDAWKDFNTEWMVKTSVPKDVVDQILGYVRAAEIYYRSGEDSFAKPQVVAPEIRAVFVDPIIIS